MTKEILKTKSVKRKKASKKLIKTKPISEQSIPITENSKIKPRKKVKGWFDDIFVESIQVDGCPVFLCYDKNTQKIYIQGQINYAENIFKPYKQDDCGYKVYSFSELELDELIKTKISTESILDDIKEVVDSYIDAEPITKCLIQIDLLITYCQELISTVHYPFFVGETESGKSSALHLFKHLAYRCLYGVNMPTANIYNFLGTEEEATGTIAEDEAQEIYKDSEKIRLYKSSYSRGDFQARMLMFSHFKKQVYYRTFCFKLFAGERVPFDKGFTERLAIVNMVQGEPKFNIKILSPEQVKKLNNLRNKLLVWKMQNLELKLPLITEPILKGRNEELWSDFIKIAKDTKYFKQVIDTAKYFIKQRQDSISDSFDARLFASVLNNLDFDYKIEFEKIWENIINNSEPEISIDNISSQSYYDADPKKKTSYDSQTGEKITKPSIAKKLLEKFYGQKIIVVDQESYGQKRKTFYKFTEDTLQKLSKKYKKTFTSKITPSQ